jgi:hypothetical protein
MLELAFNRAIIYSKVLGKHDLGHEEFHHIIENRNILTCGKVIDYNSKYLKFMLRELK